MRKDLFLTAIADMVDGSEVVINYHGKPVRGILNADKQCVHPWGSDVNTFVSKYPNSYCRGMYLCYAQFDGIKLACSEEIVSDCCDAEIKYSDICSSCGEHCSPRS